MEINSIVSLNRLFEKDNLSFVIKGEFNDDMTHQLISLSEFNFEKSDTIKNVKKRISYLMMESFQNIIRHGEKHEELPSHTKGMFAIRRQGNRTYISSSNHIQKSKVEKLNEKLTEINRMSPDEIKELYGKSLSSNVISESGGAGLGFIDMARKTGQKLEFEFVDYNQEKSLFFFQLKSESTVNESKESLPYFPLSDTVDLYYYMKWNNVSMIYKGDLSQKSILPILKMIEGQLIDAANPSPAYKKVFSILVELLQNVNKHGISSGDQSKEGIFNMGATDTYYFINCGNYLAAEKENDFRLKLETLLKMNKEELQKLFIERLKEKNSPNSGNLGIIKILKDYCKEYKFEFYPVDETRMMFINHIKVERT